MKLQELNIARQSYGRSKGKLLGKISVKGQDYATEVELSEEDIKPVLIAASGVIMRALQKTAAIQEAELNEALALEMPSPTKEITETL